jgi:hypothetical protein
VILKLGAAIDMKGIAGGGHVPGCVDPRVGVHARLCEESAAVVSRPLEGEAPTIALAVGYSKANTSPILKLFLSRLENCDRASRCRRRRVYPFRQWARLAIVRSAHRRCSRR